MVEKLSSIYGPEDSDEVTGIWRIIWQKNFIFPKEWFTDLVELPFETVTVPAPAKYHEVLRLKVGDNYMTPIRQETHNYPFYKKQEDMIFQKYGFRPE
jgi:lipopolysaccharide cholinephosphotransferase